jgi:hypothetical protein
MASAEDAFEFQDDLNAEVTHSFTNAGGGAVSLTDGMVVFEGELKADIAVVPQRSSAADASLASIRMLVQIRLFDELPSSNEVAGVQGAIAALKDSTPPEVTTGTYFAWGSTNAAPMAWVPLMMTNNGPQFAVSDGATNYITFVFNYTNPATTYQVFIGETASPDDQQPSQPVTSQTNATEGISGVSLFGTGGLKSVAASALPGPLSASIGFSVYNTSKGTLLILDTVSEQREGWLIVKAFINGEYVEIGRYWATGSGSNHYEFLATAPLALGQSFAFQVIDEMGDLHTLSQPVEVKAIKMDSVVMDAESMIVTFNTEGGRSYQVLVADSLDAEVWTVAVVHYPILGGWEYGAGPFTAGGVSTTIKIPRSASPMAKAFFKIIKTN